MAGEGDGAMLGLAAGDAAGGAWELGYSAITEQATVIAYQLIELGRLDPETLIKGVRELDGSDGEEPVYRGESPEFRSWLDRFATGRAALEAVPSLDAASRAIPLGVALRREPETLRTEAVALGRLFHADDSSVLSGVVAAGAVAAACFGQSGRDMILGVVELIHPVISDFGTGGALLGEIEALQDHVGVHDGEEALRIVSPAPAPRPWDQLKAGLLLSTPVVDRPHAPIEQAARIGGSALAAMVGGIVGARVGIRAWPWAFVNDTWFAEIGRRLVRGPSEVADLPIPYAVEHHLIAGERQGPY